MLCNGGGYNIYDLVFAESYDTVNKLGLSTQLITS